MNLFGGNKSASVSPQVYTGIQVSTSMQGQPIPLAYGMNRLPMNLLQYGGFTKHPQSSSGGGKGGSPQNNSYTYSAWFAAGLCEGPIAGLGQIWHDRAIVTLAYENLTLFLGQGGQPAWTVPPSAQQIPYDHIAYVASSNFNFGGSAAMPNLSFEVKALLYNTGPPGPQFGGTFTGNLQAGSFLITNCSPPGALAASSILSDSVGAIPGGTTALAVALTFTASLSLGATSATLTAVTGYPNGTYDVTFSNGDVRYCSIAGTAVTWTGGLSSSATTAANALPLNFVLMSNAASSNASGDTISYTVNGTSSGDADASLVITDYLTDPNHGAGYIGTVANLLGNDNYQGYVWSLGIGVSPVETSQRQASDFLSELMLATNSELVESAGTLRVIPYCDAAVSGNGYSYTPNLTPVYSFTDDDYLDNGNSDPVELTRKPLRQTYNFEQIEILDRANAYNIATVQAYDQDDINAYGLRPASTRTFHLLTNVNTARTIGQLLLQADLFRRNSYRFKVRADYCLLEPMDVVAITDSGLGITGQLGWVTSITESGADELELEVLEITGLSNTTPQYNWSSSQGYQQNYNSSPGSVSAPLFFVMPPALSGVNNDLQLGIAVGGPSTSANWGGCYAYMSADGGNSYWPIGVVGPNGVPRYGTLAATFASGSDPDTTHTLSIQFQSTSTTLDAATSAEADSMQSLLYLDPNGTPEIVAYSAATAAGAGLYNLGTYIRRGQYSTSIASHSSGVPFARIDGSILIIDMDPGWIGQTLHFKFCSVNTVGQAAEDISTVTDYTYTVPAATVGNLPLVVTGSAIANGSTVAKATTGSAAWDSAVYSSQMFQSCQASCRAPSAPANTRFMLGLSQNPSASSSYTNADFALFVDSTGTLQVYESGVSAGSFGSWVAGDSFAISYDGAVVRYFHNGVAIKQTPAAGLSLALFIPIYQPGTTVTAVQFSNQAAGKFWLAFGNCVASDTNVTKVAGGAGPWDSSAITTQGYPQCAITSKQISVSGHVMMGLTTTPNGNLTGGSQYTDINYAWYNNAGTWQIYESGTLIGSYGSSATTDFVGITYGGSNVIYWLNGVSKRTVPVSGLTLFGKVSCYDSGAGVNCLEFSNSAALPVMDTAQLGLNASSQIASAISAGTTTCSVKGAPNNTDIVTAAVTTNGYPIGIDISVDCSPALAGSGAAFNSPMILSITRDGTTIGTATFNVYNFITNVAGNGAPVQLWDTPVTLTVIDTPSAGSHTYALNFNGHQATSGGGAPNLQQVNFTNAVIKIREYKR